MGTKTWQILAPSSTQCTPQFVAEEEFFRDDYVVREYVGHYHEERPHQGLRNWLIAGEPPPLANGDIQRRTRLGGLLKHYYRAAA
jgi:hypothetical protein